MIACRINQIGTRTVGTKDHGACCIASEPGPGNTLRRGDAQSGAADPAWPLPRDRVLPLGGSAASERERPRVRRIAPWL